MSAIEEKGTHSLVILVRSYIGDTKYYAIPDDRIDGYTRKSFAFADRAKESDSWHLQLRDSKKRSRSDSKYENLKASTEEEWEERVKWWDHACSVMMGSKYFRYVKDVPNFGLYEIGKDEIMKTFSKVYLWRVE